MSVIMDEPKNLKTVVFTDNIDFDAAITATGYGRFHYQIISVGAILLLANGFQNGLSPYVFAGASCELVLTSAQLGYLNVTFLVGGVVSTFLWGTLADMTGRRRVLIFSLWLDFVVTLLCALMNSFFGLAICRFINGFLIGAPGSITYNYIAEFHGPKHRAKSICYTSISFTGAWLVLPLLGYAILPLRSIEISENYSLSSWRLLLIILAIPELIAGIWLVYLPETPKYHMAKGDLQKALNILQRMYAMNSQKSIHDYPIKNLTSNLTSNRSLPILAIKSKEKGIFKGKLGRVIKDVIKQIKCLFRTPYLLNSLLMSTAFFCNMFGFFGLGLWLPELFKRFHEFQLIHPNETISVKNLSQLHLEPIVNETISCIPEFNDQLLQSTLSVGISCIIGNLLAGWLTGFVAMKLLPAFSMLIGAVTSGSIYFLRSSTQNLIVSCIYQMAMTIANITLGSATVELFPTAIGAMAFCVVLFAGRLGAIFSNTLFGLLMDKHCEVPIFSVALVVGIGGLLCLIIPSNKERQVQCCPEDGFNVSNVGLRRGKYEISVISDQM